ncbi:MAG: putative metal-binding motif-containing protein, partial [Myxococcota bacterium]
MSVLLLLVPAVFANSTGKTGSSTTGCGDCHGRSASTGTSVTFDADTLVAAPGERLAIELVVASSSVTYGAGLNVSATGGTLGAGSNTRVSGGEVTHSSTTRMASGAVTFAFTWTAPTAEGTYTLRGAGNAVNGDRSDGGDAWNRASNLTLTVDDGCDDTDRDGYEACDDGGGDDCDDDDASVHPGAAETCDGVDEDCDGTADDAPASGTSTW